MSQNNRHFWSLISCSQLSLPFTFYGILWASLHTNELYWWSAYTQSFQNFCQSSRIFQFCLAHANIYTQLDEWGPMFMKTTPNNHTLKHVMSTGLHAWCWTRKKMKTYSWGPFEDVCLESLGTAVLEPSPSSPLQSSPLDFRDLLHIKVQSRSPELHGVVVLHANSRAVLHKARASS